MIFASDLIEARAALYAGDTFYTDCSTETLEKVKRFRAQNMIGGHRAVTRGKAAIEQTRALLNSSNENRGAAHTLSYKIKDIHSIS